MTLKIHQDEAKVDLLTPDEQKQVVNVVHVAVIGPFSNPLSQSWNSLIIAHRRRLAVLCKTVLPLRTRQPVFEKTGYCIFAKLPVLGKTFYHTWAVIFTTPVLSKNNFGKTGRQSTASLKSSSLPILEILNKKSNQN